MDAYDPIHNFCCKKSEQVIVLYSKSAQKPNIAIFHVLLCRTFRLYMRIMQIRHGSNERDRSSPTERSSSVMLSAAKHLSADRDRPFAALRVTRCDGSNGQGLFFTIEPCLIVVIV